MYPRPWEEAVAHSPQLMVVPLQPKGGGKGGGARVIKPPSKRVIKPP